MLVKNFLRCCPPLQFLLINQSSEHDEQYLILPSYHEKLTNTNNGVSYFLQVDEENISFHQVLSVHNMLYLRWIVTSRP
jgi:hypothetical protein